MVVRQTVLVVHVHLPLVTISRQRRPRLVLALVPLLMLAMLVLMWLVWRHVVDAWGTLPSTKWGVSKGI